MASTKAFTAQLTVLLSLAIRLGVTRGHLTAAQAESYETMVLSLPGAVGRAIGQFEAVRTVAQYLKRKKTCLFFRAGASLSSGT